jgi:hypothetical protein
MNDGAAGRSPVHRVSIREHRMFSEIEIPPGWLVTFPHFIKALQQLHKTGKCVNSDWSDLDAQLASTVFGKIAGIGPRRRIKRVVYGNSFSSVKAVSKKILRPGTSFSKLEKNVMTRRPKPDSCEACGRTNIKICWDHDHLLRNFRGWLCSDCNTALGFVADSVDRLNKLAEYLEKSRQPGHFYSVP